MNELKKCPFCGGKAMFSGGNSWIVCEDCLAESGFFDYKHDAIKAWNNRKPLECVIERLETEGTLADEERDRCARENPLHFDTAKGYATGIYNAIEIIKEEMM